MPHSIPSDHSHSQVEDDDLPDAPPTNPSETASAVDNDIRDDIVMDSGEGGEKKDMTKIDIKLQDLFNDMDEDDEEFSSSRADTKVKLESSPPPAPL